MKSDTLRAVILIPTAFALIGLAFKFVDDGDVSILLAVLAFICMITAT